MVRCGCPNCDHQAGGSCVLDIIPKDGGCERGNNSFVDYEVSQEHIPDAYYKFPDRIALESYYVLRES